jgi:hypothetical protein
MASVPTPPSEPAVEDDPADVFCRAIRVAMSSGGTADRPEASAPSSWRAIPELMSGSEPVVGTTPRRRRCSVVPFRMRRTAALRRLVGKLGHSNARSAPIPPREANMAKRQ